MVEALIKRGDLDEADARDLDCSAKPSRPRHVNVGCWGGRADILAAWSDSLLVAEAVEKVGADGFYATIVPVG